jgi:hypothetical protein
MNLDANTNIRQQQISNSIVLNLIIGMGLPLSIVDNVSFRNFMNDVDSRYQPISRRNITRSFLPVLEKQCTTKLKEICSKSPYVSLTLDCWSDRRMRTYFGITLHTIVDDKYKSYLLSFEQLHGKHSGEKIAAEFDRIIQIYDLKDKIVRLVTDNASNNLAAFDDIILPGFEDYFDELENDQSDAEPTDRDKKKEEEEEEEDDDDEVIPDEKQFLHVLEIDDTVYETTLNAAGDDEYLRIPCFSHCLQLVVNDGIKASGVAASPLKKVANLAKLAHTSTIFAGYMEKAHFTIPKANRTRWNSQYQMVKHVLDIPSSTLNSILTDMKKTNLILSTRDRKILEEFISLFELFYEATVLTQGETYATISLVAPTILGILYDLEREQSSQTLILSTLCNTLISSIKSRFSGLLRHFEIDVPFNSHSMSERFSDLIFLITPVLDARFKLLWLNNLKIDVKTRVVEKIRNAFVHLYTKIKFQSTVNMLTDGSNGTTKTNSITSTISSGSSIKRKSLFPYINEHNKKICSDPNTKILDEIDQFLCEEIREENFLFTKKYVYPHLYIIALKYLSVPATTASIERVLSYSGFIIRQHRARLTSKNVCLLSFLKCNKMLLS